jgi:hypothetical protein
MERIVPERFDEGWGTWHGKWYGVDDEVILSGWVHRVKLLRRVKADIHVHTQAHTHVQGQPRHVVLYQPTRSLHPLPVSPFSSILPILAHPAIHSLLIPPLPITESIRIATSPRPATLPSWLTLHPRCVDLASTFDPPTSVLPTRPRHTLGVPELVAGLQRSETEARGRGHVVLAGDPSWGTRYQGGGSGDGQGMEGGPGVSWRKRRAG